MEALQGIKNIQIYDNTMFHIEDCMEEYKKYIAILEEFSLEELSLFLKALRKSELINNQEVEDEPALLMELESEREKKNSIEMMAKVIREKRPITKEDIQKIHKKLIQGTIDDQERNYPYRNFPTKVGRKEGDVELISYIPPNQEEVIPYMDYLLDYLNDDSSLQIETIFIKPMIAHAYIAILQPFGNGNTRIARLLQYGKIQDLTNKYFQKDFSYPILYLSKNYLLTKSNYRGNIGRIAEFHNDQYWNKWFTYNLNMIDEQLFYVMRTLEEYNIRKSR